MTDRSIWLAVSSACRMTSGNFGSNGDLCRAPTPRLATRVDITHAAVDGDAAELSRSVRPPSPSAGDRRERNVAPRHRRRTPSSTPGLGFQLSDRSKLAVHFGGPLISRVERCDEARSL
jgi:hypothetical protein